MKSRDFHLLCENHLRKKQTWVIIGYMRKRKNDMRGADALCCLCNNPITNLECAYNAVPVTDGPCCADCYRQLVVPMRRAYEDALKDYEKERNKAEYDMAHYTKPTEPWLAEVA